MWFHLVNVKYFFVHVRYRLVCCRKFGKHSNYIDNYISSTIAQIKMNLCNDIDARQDDISILLDQDNYSEKCIWVYNYQTLQILELLFIFLPLVKQVLIYKQIAFFALSDVQVYCSFCNKDKSCPYKFVKVFNRLEGLKLNTHTKPLQNLKVPFKVIHLWKILSS